MSWRFLALTITKFSPSLDENRQNFGFLYRNYQRLFCDQNCQVAYPSSNQNCQNYTVGWTRSPKQYTLVGSTSPGTSSMEERPPPPWSKVQCYICKKSVRDQPPVLHCSFYSMILLLLLSVEFLCSGGV